MSHYIGRLFLLWVLAALILGGCQPGPNPLTAASTSTAEPVSPRVVGYFTSWGVGSRGYTVSKIPAAKLTHLNYAFGAINYFGKCSLGDPVADTQKFFAARDSVDGVADTKDGGHGNFNQFLKLKQKYPDIKILISIGGWNGSDQFTKVAETDETRQKFVSSCIELYLQKYPGVFDGIDIDWEYPVSGGYKPGKPEDRQNFTFLLAELRKELDAQGRLDNKHYLLTIAAPAGPKVYANYELDKIAQYLDFINLMTYDFHGTWDKATGFLSPLYASASDPSPNPDVKNKFNADATVQAYLKAGIPPSKLVLGIPFYGRGWEGVPAANNGLYQVGSGPAKGTWEPGAFDYSDIAKRLEPEGTRYWSEDAKVPWLYIPQNGVWVTYEDPQSVAIKAEYVMANHLGGVMFWELSNDGGVLLDAMYQKLYP